MLASTNLNITPGPGGSRMNSIVNAIVEDLLRAQHVAAHTEALKAYGEAAVPGLLPHLHSADGTRCSIALYALQYCWSQAARGPVAGLLRDTDPVTRHMAAIVLAKHEGTAALARLCEPLLDEPDPAVAGFAFERVESEGPDLPRMLRFMRKPPLWDHVWKYLPRYYSQTLTPMTLRMITNGNTAPALAAVAALIHQHKRSAAIRRGMADLLLHVLPEARELAAEYLLWHATAQETGALRTAQERERDPYVRAGVAAALAAAERRAAAVPEATGNRAEASSPALAPIARESELSAKYLDALASLSSGTTAEKWNAAFELYRSAELFEPYWAYKGEDAPEEFVAARESRLRLQACLLAIPWKRDKAEETWGGEFQAEPAASLVAPVRNYFDPKRESFGKVMEEDAEGFGGMVHNAEDVAWHRDHRTVVAIGNGLVREVRCAPTWGFMLVIEHVLPDGQRFCSLYAHLSPFVCVAPGDSVTKGRKIGSIGRGYTWENGGYVAHLHFGIHKGPFWHTPRPGSLLDVRFKGTLYTGRVTASDQEYTVAEIHTPSGAYVVRRPSSWICGYVSKACWDQKRHDWANPQEFLTEHEA